MTIRLPARRWLILAGLPLVAIPVVWLSSGSARESAALVTTVRRGPFQVVVTATGELRAPKFVQIQGPAASGTASGMWQAKITSLVPEGTVVKKGEAIAELDRQQLSTELRDGLLALQKAEAELDTTLTLSQAREEIRNLELALEEKRLAKEQAVFEPPSVQRQAALDYEKTERQLAQSRVDYTTKRSQAAAKTRQFGADLQRQRDNRDRLQRLMRDFSIVAPAGGMVIYAREWNGQKRGVGSMVNSYEPGVATLPDFSEFESVTYVNEIDVRKIAVGQRVRVSLDANPAQRLAGRVAAVANVGEQRPHSDAKVFEVTIHIETPDSTLRPGMTTSNAIAIASIPDAVSIPLEAVMANAGRPFVYQLRARHVVRQPIETGLANENEVIVRRGLAAGDQILLADPHTP